MACYLGHSINQSMLYMKNDAEDKAELILYYYYYYYYYYFTERNNNKYSKMEKIKYSVILYNGYFQNKRFHEYFTT